MSNTITAYFKGRVGVAESVYQNDYGIVMAFDSIDLPAHFDCYFSILNQEEAVPGVGADNMVAIPNSVLANPGTVTIHIPLHTGANDSEVEYIVYFKVIGRARPIDDGTPVQMTAIEQALALLQNPIGNIEQIVNEALAFTGTTLAGLEAEDTAIKGRVSTLETDNTSNKSRIATAENDIDSLDARVNNLATLTEGSTTGDAELIDARVVGSKTYATLHEAIDTEISDLKSNINELDIGYVNIFDKSTITAGKKIESAGIVSDQSNTAITDYIPVQLMNNAYYIGITGTSNNTFAASYDSSKTLIATFSMQLGETALNDYITANTRYVRFTLNVTQRDEPSTFKLFSKTLALHNEVAELSADVDAMNPKVSALTSLSNKAKESGINLLNNNTLSADKYINHSNGKELDYSGWSATDYIEVTPGTDYLLIVIGGSSTYAAPAGTEYAFYDSSKQFVSGGITAATTPITAPAGAKYIRLSRATSGFTYAMFGVASDIEIYDELDMHDFDKVEYGNYLISNKFNIVDIEEPFVFYQWNDYCYFKFKRIWYVDYDGEKKEYSYDSSFTRMFADLIVATNTSRVRNCCHLEEGYTFIFSERLRRFVIVESSDVENKDTIILACDNNGLMSGALFDIYNSQQSYYTARQSHKNIPENILNTLDYYLPNITLGKASECFTFANVADNHGIGAYTGTEVNLTAMAIDHIDKMLTFDAIIDCGDEILTSSAGGDARVALSESINAYDVDKLVFCEGNHDRGIISPVISHKQYYNLVLRHWKDDENVHTVYPKAYYYRDYPKQKIRVVCVTTYDMPDDKQSTYPYNDYYGYNWEQMNWLRDEALRIDSDWSVLVIDHSLPVTTAEGMTGNGSGGQNPLVLRQLLESFKNGTNVHITHEDTATDGFFDIDMTTQFDTQGERTLIGVLGGHTHIDTIVEINGISYVATCCGYIDSVEYSGNRGNRNGLTYSAICFDIGMIDTDNREVSLYRIGFVPTGGSSPRTFSY